MASESPVSAKEDQQIMSTFWCGDIKYYPERAVMYGFPWGKKGTTLAKVKGPRKWQLRELERYGEHIRENMKRASQGKPLETYQLAVCSGRGIGKSALYGMISWYLMTCWTGSTTIVAANGEPQLDSKTFPEIKKWFTLAINSHWFDLNARSVRPTQWFKENLETELKIDCGYYYVQGQLWTEDKPDAFAGAHNPLGIIVLFDEASGIPQAIWTVTKGFFTEDCVTRAHLAFSNGRANTGPFFECFHKMRNFWKTLQIDSRDVEGVDSADLTQIIAQHGEDSDEARIEVRGMFPSQGDRQLIGHELADAAQSRPIEEDTNASLLMGIDVARFGEDKTVFAFRQGRDARSIPWQTYKKEPADKIIQYVLNAVDKYDPDAIFIDANGVGGPIADILRNVYHLKIIDVQAGNVSSDERLWANKRTECWCKMADWLTVGAIPTLQILRDDLVGPLYELVGKDDAKFLEPKDKMKSKRGLASPDMADALSLTFAKTVPRRNARAGKRRNIKIAKDVDYAVL